MYPYLLALGLAAIAYVLYSFVVHFLTERRYAAEAERQGCRAIPQLPNRYPLGLDRVLQAIQADRKLAFPDLLLERNELMGDRTYGFNIMGSNGIVTNDPKNVQAILATQFSDFCLGSLRRNNFFPLLGNGIFTQDGKGWEHSRAMMRPQFTREQVSDLSLEERHVQNMMLALPVAGGWTAEVDLQVLFFRLTLDSSCEFLFGEPVGSQLANLPGNDPGRGDSSRDEKRFAFAFDNGQKWLASRGRWFNLYWIVDGLPFRRSIRDVNKFVDCFVDVALNKGLKEVELEKNHASSGHKYVFLDALVAQTRDPVELRSQMLNILLAGRDTTASLLGWLFYLLVRHPTVYHHLRISVLQHFGSYAAPKDLTYVGIKNCHYLQYCLNETLRLYPVVPFNLRFATRDTTLPRGGGPDGNSKIFVRAGQEVDYSVHIMHRRSALWGPDADEFKPERWVGRKLGWEYLPFNGGPRICLGRELFILFIERDWSGAG